MGNYTKKIALNGIFAALVVISLFFATVFPTTKLSFYALSSFFVTIIILEYRVTTGLTFYIATNIIAFIVLPSKITIIPYTIFFGFYGIIKYYIERLFSPLLKYVLKFVYFNLSIVLAVFIINRFLLDDLSVKLPLLFLVVFFQIVFLLYDYMYTLFIRYYLHRLRQFLNI